MIRRRALRALHSQAALCGMLVGAAVHASAQVQPATVTAAPMSAAPAQPAKTPPTKATVQQLAWVAGAWRGTLGDRTVEQHWSAPLGNSIVAMYRSVQGDRALLYELLAIEQEGEGVFLRIKHFAPGAGLVGREVASVDHALIRVSENSAVFEGTSADNPARITFTKPDADTLTIVVERKPDGAPVSTEFKYTRLK